MAGPSRGCSAAAGDSPLAFRAARETTTRVVVSLAARNASGLSPAAAEHPREGPAIEGGLDVGDISVLDHVPLRDKSRGGYRGFGFQLEEDRGVIPFPDDLL